MFNNYITLEDNNMIVYCMNCNDRKNPIIVNGRVKSHHTTYDVKLEDESFASMQICITCLSKITSSDYSKLENTMFYGWEQELKYKRKKNSNINVQQVLTKLKKGKKIVGKFNKYEKRSKN